MKIDPLKGVVTEAGAETPWEEATRLLQKHLEPDPFEETAGEWSGTNWDYTARCIMDHSVVGRLEGVQVTSGR